MPVLTSYRNQSIDLLCKSIDWFLYEGNTGTEANQLTGSYMRATLVLNGLSENITLKNSLHLCLQSVKSIWLGLGNIYTSHLYLTSVAFLHLKQTIGQDVQVSCTTEMNTHFEYFSIVQITSDRFLYWLYKHDLVVSMTWDILKTLSNI